MVFHANDDGKRMLMKSSDDFQGGSAEEESVNFGGENNKLTQEGKIIFKSKMKIFSR